MLDARWWEINLGLSFKMEFGKSQFIDYDSIKTEGEQGGKALMQGEKALMGGGLMRGDIDLMGGT